MNRMDGVERLSSESLEKIYDLMEHILSDELAAADKLKREKVGWKVAFTRIRVKLSEVSKLCKEARKEILAMKKKESEKEMEKYGVDEDEDPMTKRGAPKDSSCPKCDETVEVHGAVRKCPSCGTSPFEGSEESND
jgi:hypothetical protein